MIAAAGGPRFTFGFDEATYQSQWSRRAIRVSSPSEAKRGDIVQWGPGPVPHTAIVIQPGANPRVIDSNARGGERILRGPLLTRARGQFRIWRVGRIANPPVGRFDVVTSPKPGQIRVRGWAFDPDSSRRSVPIHIYIDGKAGSGARRVVIGAATKIRDDVARSNPGAGSAHGFDATFTAPRGKRAVHIYAIDVAGGGGSKYLGGKTVSVAPAAIAPEPVADPDPESTPADPIAPAFVQGQLAWTAAIGDQYQSFMGDFNADGNVDIGVRRMGDGDFYWRLGPSFAQGTLQAWAAGSHFQSFMGDFNGDGNLDVGLRRATDGDFYWRLGPSFAQGTLQAWATGDHFQSFMGDFNSDGHVDVGLRRTTDGVFYWRLGPGFAQGSHAWAAGAHFQSFMGDFNRDGHVDIGLRRTTDGVLYWKLGPDFGQAQHTWAAGDHFQSFMGDFNRDGKVDLGLRRTTDGIFYWRLAR